VSFQRLAEEIKRKNNRTVMGLDPDFKFIPPCIYDKQHALYGDTLEAGAAAALEFCLGLIDAAADLVAAVKPQSAYFEQYGVYGMSALAAVIDAAKKAGLYVILDAKRGDIGTTSAAYASAAIGRTAVGGASLPVFGADCVTVNPYLGSDGVMPFVDAAKKYGGACFALVKTSNKSSDEFQNLRVDGGEPLYIRVARMVETWGGVPDGSGYTCVGAVIGATYPRELAQLRGVMPHTFFLVPGYGAQGGGAADVAAAFDKNGGGAVVNASRSLMCAYKSAGDERGDNYKSHTRAAVTAMRDDINSAL
jgi:orotidine-5'-phosphate decarboxylase